MKSTGREVDIWEEVSSSSEEVELQQQSVTAEGLKFYLDKKNECSKQQVGKTECFG